MFKIIENIETIENTKSATGIEITISLETENFGYQWRVIQERILSDDEVNMIKSMA